MKFAGKIFPAVIFLSAGILSAQIAPTNRIKLFNGTNFDGFTFCMKNGADPMQTWSVTNGMIHCNGSAIGYLRTKQSFSNCTVTVKWRFLYVTPKKNNSGVLVDMQLPDKVWPQCVQNQGKSGRQGDLFVMAGAECKEHLALGKDMNTPVAFTGASAENPVGQWNTNVTVCAGNTVQAIINGKSLNKISECTISNGFVGIQSEGADFEIRKMYLEPLRQQEFFKTITDARTGEYAVANSDKSTVMLKDKNGNIIWSTDIAKGTEKDIYILGERKIYSMNIWKKNLAVQFGKAWVELDIPTGKILSIGQN